MTPLSQDPHHQPEWRCLECGKLLGQVRDGRLLLRLSRGHTLLVGFPATMACRGCRTLNELASPHSLDDVRPAQVER